MGFLPPVWLALFLAAIGLLCGLGERFLYRMCSPARLVLLAGAVNCALGYEQGLPGMLTTLRTAVVIAVAAKAAEVIWARRASKRVRQVQWRLPSEFA